MAVLGVSLVELSLPGQWIVAVLVVSFVELFLSGQRIVAGFARLSGLFETAATFAGVVSVAVAAPGVVSVAAPASAVVYAYKVAAAAVVVVAVVVVVGSGRQKHSLLVGAREANFAPSFAAPRLLADARAA